jgi:hypothetical protein
MHESVNFTIYIISGFILLMFVAPVLIYMLMQIVLEKNN